MKKGYLLLAKILNVLFSPREIITEQLARDKRLERYKTMETEGLKKTRSLLVRQLSDVFSPNAGVGQKIDDIDLILHKRELEEDNTAKLKVA